MTRTGPSVTARQNRTHQAVKIVKHAIKLVDWGSGGNRSSSNGHDRLVEFGHFLEFRATGTAHQTADDEDKQEEHDHAPADGGVELNLVLAEFLEAASHQRGVGGGRLNDHGDGGLDGLGRGIVGARRFKDHLDADLFGHLGRRTQHNRALG